MRIFLASGLCAVFTCGCQPSALSQNSPSERPELAIRVSLELRRGNQWQRVDPQTVFHNSDEIRFRFLTSLGGYLYVMNHSSDGEVIWLFPMLQEGQTSRVEPGPEYLVPGSKGSFVVSGRPGFDVTYWVLSSVPIDKSEAAQPKPGGQPSTLEPRCRAEVLKARGLCVDERAGPRPITTPEQAPLEVLRGRPLVSRDLKFHTQDGSTRISATNPQSRVIVYEFRVAHN